MLVHFAHPFHVMVVEKLLETTSGDFEELKGVDALGVLLFYVAKGCNVEEVPLVFEQGETDFLAQVLVWDFAKKLEQVLV